MCTNGVEKRLETGPVGARGTNIDVGSYVGRMVHYVGNYVGTWAPVLGTMLGVMATRKRRAGVSPLMVTPVVTVR